MGKILSENVQNLRAIRKTHNKNYGKLEIRTSCWKAKPNRIKIPHKFIISITIYYKNDSAELYTQKYKVAG